MVVIDVRGGVVQEPVYPILYVNFVVKNKSSELTTPHELGEAGCSQVIP